jgi:hypothetical protein
VKERFQGKPQADLPHCVRERQRERERERNQKVISHTYAKVVRSRWCVVVVGVVVVVVVDVVGVVVGCFCCCLQLTSELVGAGSKFN